MSAQPWPTGVMLRGIRPGQTFKERVEELLGREVKGTETMINLSGELLRTAPHSVVLTSTTRSSTVH